MSAHEANSTAREQRRMAWRRAALGLAAVGAAFSAVVGAEMLRARETALRIDPLHNAELIELRQELTRRPDNAELVARIRRMEQDLRTRYLAARGRIQSGRYLLTGGLAMLAVGGVWAFSAGRRLPRPVRGQDTRAQEARTALAARLLILLATGGLLTAGAVSAWHRWFPPPEGPEQLARAAPATQPAPPATHAEPYPTTRELARHWPRFRGPGGGGIARHDGIPTRWNGETGEGITWKVPVPRPGYSSPVVWGGRVFLTGADAETREVYCFGADSGELLWRRPIRPPGSPGSGEAYDEQMHAAPTPATDGRRVYALFGNGDLAAFDMQGEPVWSKALGLPDMEYGYASSPVVYRGMLLVQFDESPDPRLLAMDAATGEPVWTARRDVGISWGTPIAAHTPSGPQIVCGSDSWVIAYRPDDGEEIWRADCLYGDQVGSSPVHAEGTVFTAYTDAFLSAIPTDKTGDATDEVLWEGDWGLPQYTSPIADGEYVYLQDGSGVVTCYDADDGEMLWDFLCDGGGYASPSLAGGKLYVLDYAGVTYVLKLNGREKPELIATNPLGEDCDATPAFAGGRIYVRSKQHLFCITGQGE
jgi:outer membrane protein assembly factor BamB